MERFPFYCSLSRLRTVSPDDSEQPTAFPVLTEKLWMSSQHKTENSSNSCLTTHIQCIMSSGSSTFKIQPHSTTFLHSTTHTLWSPRRLSLCFRPYPLQHTPTLQPEEPFWNTIVHHLTTVVQSVKYPVSLFHYCANLIKFLRQTWMPHSIPYCSEAINLYSVLLYWML